MSPTLKWSPELVRLTRELYRAVSTGDDAFFSRFLSRGACCVVIGTGPDEWWENHADALAAIREQMHAVGDGVDLTGGAIIAYERGEVGWVSDRPTFRLGVTVVACRHTSVFNREDGDWRIVQHHFSIGITNENAFGPDAARLE